MARSSDLGLEDYRLALGCAARLADLSGVTDEQGFHTHVAEAVAPLIDATWTASERFTLEGEGGGRSGVSWEAGVVLGDPSFGLSENLYEVFQGTAHEHAGLQDIANRADAGVVTMDVFKKRGVVLEDLALYRAFYRHLDVTDQLVLDVPLGACRHLTLAFSRDRAFTGREARRLELITDTLSAVSRTLWAHWDAQTSGEPQALIQSLGLPPRLARLVPFLLGGLGQKQIAGQMGLSYQTVRSYTKELYGWVGVGSREELIAKVRDEALGPNHG